MSKRQALELLLLVLSYLATGTLGLLNVLYFSNTQGDLRTSLLLAYGVIHPALAYTLWSLNKWALKAERLPTVLFIAVSLFLYGRLDPAILIISTVLYVYSFLYSFRPDAKKAFEQN